MMFHVLKTKLWFIKLQKYAEHFRIKWHYFKFIIVRQIYFFINEVYSITSNIFSVVPTFIPLLSKYISAVKIYFSFMSKFDLIMVKKCIRDKKYCNYDSSDFIRASNIVKINIVLKTKLINLKLIDN